jgi:uncharacterized protein (DUF4415 family)
MVGSVRAVDAGAMRMQYTVVMFKAVRYSDWSADHIAAHGVSMDEVREAILERPYWAARGRDGTTLIYGRTYASRLLLVVVLPEGQEAFVVTAREMTEAEKKTFPQEGTMSMSKDSEQLPRPASELEELAEYYDSHDTSAEMVQGEWVEPQPMATTSLRLPADVIDQLKRQAQARHVRYTSHVRSILERAARGGPPPEIADIAERLERIERAITGGRGADDQKTA